MPVESGLSQEEKILYEDVEAEGDPEAEDDSDVRDTCSQEHFSTPEEASQSQLSDVGEAQTGEEVLGDRSPHLQSAPQPEANTHQQPHNKNTNPGTYPCNKTHCQFCPHIDSRDTIIGPNHISHTIRGSFTCISTNVIYAIMCQQCPSAMYIGQTGQSLRKRINGHKSDVKNYNIQKPVGKHFSLPDHSITDLKVAILQQKNFKNRLQRKTAELELICKLDTIKLCLNKDWEWMGHYTK
ncbi:uncharacterized protein LOC128836129 [Malaclemys terrapin pileata]|uniref:uncharacterized protein LOC128836129 n=1 Tax=Malaclemys terrapin pileata TaxID=2991368 RepID=UPI0023A8FA56|nr:uncharacterized protein LOC128836129 [Malaclemys terrapin pileata]